MGCTVNHPHGECNDVTHKFQALQSERDALRTLLGRERDQFGKMECELKRELKEVKFARRTENDGYNQKFDHCFQNHIKQIVSKDAEIARLRGALGKIVNKISPLYAKEHGILVSSCLTIASDALAGERGEGVV